jgi:hypothetical protein
LRKPLPKAPHRDEAVLQAARQIAQLHAVAAEIDRDGESPARWIQFERLAAQLHPKWVWPNHEVRSLTLRRMRREPDCVMYRMPFENVAAMARAWVREAAT